MLKNYFKIAWRNLIKGKWYSMINIVGLAMGMAVALLIGLWIWDELTYNTYHSNHSRLAQLMTTQTFNGETGTGDAIAVPMGPELRTKHGDDFKQVSLASWNFGHILGVGDKQISTTGMWVEPVFPTMFSLRMISGTQNALKDPSSMLIRKSVAKALFGNDDPMNKTVRVDNKFDMKIGGVYEDLPRNTTFYDMEILMPWDKYVSTEPWLKNAATQWGNHSFQLFVQLFDRQATGRGGASSGASAGDEKKDFDRITAKIKDIPKEHNKEGKEEVILQPMDNWHLFGEFKNGKVVGGRIQFVWLFGIIGIFVLLLACINFMNLSTARSEKRAKEVGIRKAVGSLRTQLIGQFLSESVVVAFLSFVVAIGLVLLLLPFFNGLADKKMSIPWTHPSFWLVTLGFTLITGLVAGSYPAFYLSSFQPIKVLKGSIKAGRFASLPRKVLVVIQFTVSITLIIGTIIVFRQIQFAKNRPVGYTREGLLSVFMNTPDINGHYDALRRDLLATGALENMAESSSPATQVWSNQIGFDWRGKDPNSVPLFGIVATTHDFGSTIGWRIKEGRDFSRDFTTDTGALILNESAVALTGLKHPVGETIKWDDKNHLIVGVVKDMIMESPYKPVKPTIFYVDYGWTQVITLRIKSSMPIRTAITRIEPVFKKYNPSSPFEYKFVDEDYAKKFSDEERIGNLATFFAVLAIFISCLGLFGLASFVAEQRTREIGIRKVLGASVFTLWQMLSKEFVALVVISFLIAIPIAWYYLTQWLQKYQYHTQVSWWVIFSAGIGALVITLLTVSYQAIAAALMSPIKSLRAE